MKKLFKKYLHGLVFGLGILSILGLGYYLVSARTGSDSLTSEPGDKLTSAKLNQIMAKINSGGGGVNGITYDETKNYYTFTGSIKAGNSTTCDSNTKGAFRTTDDAVQICDGTEWTDLKSFELGTANNPASSCYQIYQNNPSAADKVYWIKPGGNPVQVWCDISGGGRTLVVRIVANTGHKTTAQTGSITSPSQSSAWKLSDADINTISKVEGYKLACNGVTVTFGSTCLFGATTVVAGACNPSGAALSERGIANRPTTPKVIYAYSSTSGCHDGTNRSNLGRFWVK